MNLTLGENLKKCRLSKGMTQEQAAEIFGVSAQAVSRWENSAAYPDITLLPGIAIFYDTTVDALLGMDAIRAEDAMRRIHLEVHRLVAQGEARAAAAFIRECLKTYPGNPTLLMTLGETLAHLQDDPEAVKEAIHVAEKVLQNRDIAMKARSTTCANLLFLYLRTGRYDDARALVKSLPHIWESREILMAELGTGEDYADALRESVMKSLVFLCQKIDALPTHQPGRTPDYIQLGVDFTPTQSVDAMLESLRRFLLG